MSAAAETATVSTPTTASPAARKRVSGQSPGESGSRSQTIMVLRNIGYTPLDATASVRLVL